MASKKYKTRSEMDYPTHDMDGGSFHEEPSAEDVAEYEQWLKDQDQSAEWQKAGLCYWCGAKPPLIAGLCPKCLSEMERAM